MKKVYALFLLGISLYPPAQAQLSLVKPMRLFSTLYHVGNQVLFFGTDDPDIFSNNYELWATDGTTAGTHLVQEIYPGTVIGSIPPENDWDNGTGSYRPFLMDDLLYFTASSPVRSYGLWRSNGTAAGTYIVYSGITFNYSGTFHFPYFCRLGNILYFAAYGASGGDNELWRTDGTAAGTFRVKNISPGFDSEPTNLVAFNGAIYFAAWNENSGSELWKSDGTDAGTVMVKDFYTGQRGVMDANSSSRILPWFTVSGSYLYFIGNANSSGGTAARLYRTDGTDAGTIQLNADVIPQELTDVNGTLFFYGYNTATAEYGLYRSDGTPAGTVHIPTNNSIVLFPGSEPFTSTFHAFKNKLYFPGAQLQLGVDTHLGIYESDGTTAGTIQSTEMPMHDELVRNTGFINDASGLSFFWRSLIQFNTNSDNRIVQMDGAPNNYKIYYGASADANGTLLNGDLYFKGRDTTVSTEGYGLYKVHPTLASAPLPLTWLSFDAVHNSEGGIDLHWQTASESNNKGFNVERSSDGKTYFPLHWIEGAGTSSTPRSYAWTDPQPLPGKNFYRLQQVDIDGKADYSVIKEIEVTPTNSLLVIAPNPLTGSTMYIRHHLAPGKVRVKITDMAGRVMSTREYTISGTTLSCDIQFLRTGVYLMEMTADGKILGSGLFVRH